MLLKIYNTLLKTYGYQGWWPLLSCKGTNPTKTGSMRGYHPGDYSYPKNNLQKFEIIIGTILTQNTSWQQAEKALINLNTINALSPSAIISLDSRMLRSAIKPAGYFNQKASYLKNAARFFILLDNKAPARDELLAVKGIGPETADSILLYAYSQPEFVIDAYTKRIFSHLEIIKREDNYPMIKQLFENNLPKDYKLYQEYHALLVEHAKRCYARKPYDDKLLGRYAKKRNYEL